MATEILKKQTIVGTDAQYEANRNSYGEGTVFESTSLLGENDIDPAYTNKFVQKRTTTGGVYLYAYDSTGDISQSADTGANAYTVARRDAGGVLNVGDPTSQYHAVNKKYVDDGFVPKTSRIGIVYCTDNKGNQARINYSENNAAWTIAQRDGSGHVRTADPEGQNDAVNKAYVDSRFRYTHFIEVKYNAAPEPYEAYVLNGIITYVCEISTPLTSIDDLPLDVTLPIHGKMYLESIEETYTATRKTRSDGSTYLYVTYLMYTDSSGIATGYQNFEPTSFTDTVL